MSGPVDPRGANREDGPDPGDDSGRDRDSDRDREIDDLLSGRSGESDEPAAAGRAGDEVEGRAAGAPGLSQGGRSGRGRRSRAGGAADAAVSRGESRRVEYPGDDPSEGPAGDPQPYGAERASNRIRIPFNYGALVGLVFALIVAAAVVNLLTSQESGTVGIGDVGIGEKVAPFAVPIATSSLEGDANIDPDEACDVPGEDVLRICDYFDRPMVISFWFTTAASACIDQQDVFETVAERFKGRVGMVSINVRDDRGRVRDLIEERGWKVTVGHDTDGAVSNIYRVGGCPTFLFVARGGVLERAEVGRTTVAKLSSQVRSLADGQ